MIWEIILPIFVLLIIGLGARELGLLNRQRIDILNWVAFYVALPALVFDSTYSRSLKDIFSLNLVSGVFFVLLAIVAISWIVNHPDPDDGRKSVSIVQSYHTNFGYMGLPIVAMALGGAAEGKASVLLGFGSTVQILLTTTILVYYNHGESVGLLDKLKRVVFNPVILSLLLGISFSYFGPSTPTSLGDLVNWMKTLISLLSRMALPIALLGVGASIKVERPGRKLNSMLSVSALKLVVMPLLGWAIFHVLGVGETGIRAGILMLAMPTAVSTFIYTSEFGGDQEVASMNISFTTLLSILTLSGILFFLG